jgi:hypothetical protein
VVLTKNFVSAHPQVDDAAAVAHHEMPWALTMTQQTFRIEGDTDTHTHFEIPIDRSI